MRWLRRGALSLVTLAVMDYFVLPQVAGATAALHLLAGLQPWLLGTALALEALSLAAYSLLTRSLLPVARPTFSWLLRTDISALGLGHLLPGGAATSAALRYRLIRDGGTEAESTAVAIAVEGVASNLVLALLLWTGLVASILFLGKHTLYVTTAVFGAFAVVVGVAWLAGQPHRPGASTIAHLLRCAPRRLRPRLEHAAVSGSDQLVRILSNRRNLRSSASWAAGNLLLDAASLWVSIAAYGHRINVIGLIVAYGLANLVAIVPLSPGGLGILEAVLVPSLIGFGAPKAVAVLGVVTWRLFNFWAPIPVAGGCYASIRAQEWWRQARPKTST